MDEVIIGGDLNFSISYAESWGSQAQVDPMFDFFKDILDQHNLTNITMIKPMPTWRNRRVVEAAMARRLDQFLIKVPLLQILSRYRQWVGSGGISYHSPIFLEILGPDANPRAHFKFNHVWLQDAGYTSLVKDFWTSHPIANHKSTAEGLCHNLSWLKHLTIAWEKERKAKDEQSIIAIEV